MCIGSNSVNQAQDLIFVTKFEDFPNSLLPSVHDMVAVVWTALVTGQDSDCQCDHPAHHRPGNSVNSKHRRHHTHTFHHCLRTAHCPAQIESCQ